MSLGRAWQRQLGRSSGAAVVAPGAVLAAVVALWLAGGLGDPGTIGQTISGPVPVVTAHGAGSANSDRAATRLVARDVRAAAAGAPVAPSRSLPGAATRSSTGAASGGGSAPALGVSRPSSTTPPADHGPPPGHAPSAPHATAAPTPTPAPTTPGAPPVKATAVDHAVATTAAVTQTLPSAVGAAATSAVETVGATVDHLTGTRSTP